jgi:hypothetical protein
MTTFVCQNRPDSLTFDHGNRPEHNYNTLASAEKTRGRQRLDFDFRGVFVYPFNQPESQ